MGYLRFALRLWPLLVGALAVDVASIIVANLIGSSISGPPITLIAFVPLILNPLVLPTKEIYEPEHSPRDDALTDELRSLAEAAGVDPLPVHRLTGGFGREHMTAIIKDKRVFITEKALERLPIEGVRFMLAHEVAHLIRLKELTLRSTSTKAVAIALITVCGLTVASGLIVIKVFPIGWYTVLGLILMTLALIPVLTTSARAPVNSPTIELWCDRKGAELVGNPEAALNALTVMLANQTAREAKWSGYPAPEQRIAQMQSILYSAEKTKADGIGV